VNDPAAGLRLLLGVLDKLSIEYFVGGSVASSVYGYVRTTMDVDIIATIDDRHIEPLTALLSSEFYIDDHAIRQALARERPFNIIHNASMYKFDIFPLRHDAYYQIEFERRTPVETSLFGAPIRFPLASAEDTILTKLAWYRAGGETSERQWTDVTGVWAVQQGRLDVEYLHHWAIELGVSDLLERLSRETGSV
jgi:hypothetical protein